MTAIGGRSGFAQSSDSRLRLEMSRPSEPRGKRADDATNGGTNPEQLLAAAYAACFLSAIREAGREAGIAIAPDANVTARIEFDDPDHANPDHASPDTVTPDAHGDAPGLCISLIVDLPGIAAPQRQALVDRAHAISRCSRALRRSVAVRTVVD